MMRISMAINANVRCVFDSTLPLDNIWPMRRLTLLPKSNEYAKINSPYT